MLTIDFCRILYLLRRWGLVLLAGTLLAAGASYVVSEAQPKVYEAVVLLQVNPGLPDVGGGGNFNEYQAAWSLATQDARLLQTTKVAQTTLISTSDRLSHSVDVGTLLKNTKATPLPQQALITLAVRANNPGDAQLLANTMASNFVRVDALDKQHAPASYLNYLRQQIRDRRTDQALASQQNYQLQRKKMLSSADLQRSGALIEQIAEDGAQISDLQNAIQNINLRLAGAGSTAAVVDAAQKPSAPITPRIGINVLVAAILALLALSGIAALADALDPRPRTPSGVGDAVGLPLLATLHLAKPSKTTLAPTVVDASENLAPMVADEYRRLDIQLRHPVNTDQEVPLGSLLMVTGTHDGSGASVVATNLAATAARTGARVILIDANLRRPALQTLFNLPQRTGLTSLLRADNDPLSLLQETGTPNLRVLTVGNAPLEAIDLLWSARMNRTLATFRHNADVVVLDTANINCPEVDALARFSDHVIIVVNWQEFKVRTLAVLRDRSRLFNAPLVGVVVTIFSARKSTNRAMPLAARDNLRGSSPGTHMDKP